MVVRVGQEKQTTYVNQDEKTKTQLCSRGASLQQGKYVSQLLQYSWELEELYWKETILQVKQT